MNIPYAYQPHWLWYQLTRGVRNVVRWVPVIWGDEDFDWEYLAKVMEWKLRRMAESELHSPHVGNMRDHKQQITCATLLKRLQADEYFENAGYKGKEFLLLPDDVATRMVKHAIYMARQDQRYLGMMLGKYLQNWWT